MSEQTITADRLNATHIGKRVSILDDGEVVMSGKLKSFEVTQDTMLTQDWGWRKITTVIMHLSNRANDDVRATVKGDVALKIKDIQLPKIKVSDAKIFYEGPDVRIMKDGMVVR